MDARMLYLHALSPIHSGTGQSTDVIDLPIARETVFGWPYLPGSSLKGVLRDACDPGRDGGEPARRRFEAAFGPSTDRASEGAGALWFADGHLLALPVRSYHGTLAWVSCPLALERWKRDHLSAGLPFGIDVPAAPADGTIVLPAASEIARDGRVYLDELDLREVTNGSVAAIVDMIAGAAFDDAVWGDHLRRRFGVVDNDVFTFLTETATEVVARIKLKEETKTVQDGGLWYEEAVPAEAIFCCPLLAVPRNGTTAAELYAVVTPHLGGLLQIGGGASVGRGLVEARLVEAPR